MKRILLFAMMLGLLGSMIAPLGVTSQESSTVGLGPNVGDATPIISVDGAQIGTITIDEIIDDFSAYDPSYSPIRGYHYEAVVATIENSSARPFAVDPNALQIIDSDGFVAQQAFVSVIESESPVLLDYLDALAPGDAVTGAIIVELFNESVIDRMYYSPDFDISIPVLDLRAEPTAAGTPVSVVDSSGSEYLEAMVVSVTDPWDGYSEFDAPDRGSRYVLVEVSLFNLSDTTINTSPNDFTAIEEGGFVTQPGFVSFEDPLMTVFDYVELAPGQEQRGFIPYQVFADAPLVQITLGDRYSRSVVVANLGPGAPPAPTSVLDTQTGDSPSTDGSTSTDIASAPECEGLVDWGLSMVDNIGASVVLLDPLDVDDVATVDPVVVRGIADQLRTFAQEQRDSNPPPAAEDLNTLLAESYYEALAGTADKLADALESGNTATALIVTAEANAVAAIFDEGAEADQIFDAIELACPAEIDELNNS